MSHSPCCNDHYIEQSAPKGRGERRLIRSVLAKLLTMLGCSYRRQHRLHEMRARLLDLALEDDPNE